MRLAQLSGMLRYELLMHWRRGWLRIVLVAFVAAPVLITILTRESFSRLPGPVDASVATNYAIMATMAAWPMVLLVLPILAADAIPYDRQTGVWDVLNALPLTRNLYLLGKLMGVWGGAVPAVVVGAGIGALAIHLMIAPFDLGVWLVLWFAGLLFLGLVNASISVLMASGRNTRRQAVALAFGLTPLILAGFSTTSLFSFYVSVLSGAGQASSYPIVRLSDVALGLGAVTLAWLFAWASLEKRERV